MLLKWQNFLRWIGFRFTGHAPATDYYFTADLKIDWLGGKSAFVGGASFIA
jgi:hypothetical protein